MINCLRVAASLLLAIASVVAIGQGKDIPIDRQILAKEFRSQKDPSQAANYLESQAELTSDYWSEEIDDQIERIRTSKNPEVQKEAVRLIGDYLDLEALSQNTQLDKDAISRATKIKSSAIYTKEKELQSSNWLSRMIDRLKNFRLPKFNSPEIDAPTIPLWLGALLRILFYILIAVAIGLLIFLITKIRLKRVVKKRVAGLLEEGEELLSEDEYLKLADQLISEGKFREACRALYLAILLCLDTHRVARFEPNETNWEHLRRIEKSPKRPSGIDFRSVTKKFDLVWYGLRDQNLQSTETFRETYQSLLAAFRHNKSQEAQS